jgi:hypothetical protein
MMAHDIELGNCPELLTGLADLARYLQQSAQNATRVDQVEQEIWDRILLLGREALALFFRLSGSGDLGEQISLPDGSTADRLEKSHARPYRSMFGTFTLTRTCYGSREGQKIAFVPLDNRLQLPEGDYSYVLQKWDALLGAECAFAGVAETLHGLLKVKQPVGSLEQNIRHMASSVEPFRESRPLPETSEEGQVFVVSADGKGVVIRREAGDPPPKAHRGKGDKANKKRMAIVGAIYSVGRHKRTPEEVVAALFRDPRGDEPVRPRPVPVGKHVWARLSRAIDGAIDEPIDAVFTWLGAELTRRNPKNCKPVVCLMDGQTTLWDGRARHVAGEVVEILDLLHVTPRLWKAAHLFHPEGSEAAAAFVRERLLRVLCGEVKGVVKGLRRMGTEHGLVGAKKRTLRTLVGYLEANAKRMRYDAYLREGYPIASGVIEGACRHYVKDRMERAGMRWVKAGAQAMLDIRSEALNGDWEPFQAFRIDRETERLYPHRQLLQTIEWPLAT